jgi:E3 ubiquitin-protein ligase DOA10
VKGEQHAFTFIAVSALPRYRLALFWASIFSQRHAVFGAKERELENTLSDSLNDCCLVLGLAVLAVECWRILSSLLSILMVALLIYGKWRLLHDGDSFAYCYPSLPVFAPAHTVFCLLACHYTRMSVIDCATVAAAFGASKPLSLFFCPSGGILEAITTFCHSPLLRFCSYWWR